MSVADDEATLQVYAALLVDSIDDALPRWVRRCVARYVTVDRTLEADVLRAAQQARACVVPALRSLLSSDVDAQRVNPLAVVRDAVRFPTDVLMRAGVSPEARDPFASRNFPDDVYDLSPMSFGEIDPAVQEPGLLWGAAKAHVFLQRRRGTV